MIDVDQRLAAGTYPASGAFQLTGVKHEAGIEMPTVLNRVYNRLVTG